MRKQLEDYMREKAGVLKTQLLARASDRRGVKLIHYTGKGNPDILKDIAFRIKEETAESFMIAAGIIEDSKCTLLVMLSDDLVAGGLNAAKLVKDAARHIQGGGGGQPHFATAGGKNIDGLSAAVDAVIDAAGMR
ncbi:alanyl-tRNA synthetase [Bacteroidales bacterium Barb4]|nr:alanyl-tRNA synthetase [Bacteroidales bacterium Barb4]